MLAVGVRRVLGMPIHHDRSVYIPGYVKSKHAPRASGRRRRVLLLHCIMGPFFYGLGISAQHIILLAVVCRTAQCPSLVFGGKVGMDLYFTSKDTNKPAIQDEVKGEEG